MTFSNANCAVTTLPVMATVLSLRPGTAFSFDCRVIFAWVCSRRRLIRSPPLPRIRPHADEGMAIVTEVVISVKGAAAASGVSLGVSLNISAATMRAAARIEFKEPDRRIMRSVVPGKTSVLFETLTLAPEASLIALMVAPPLPMTPPTSLLLTRIFRDSADSSGTPNGCCPRLALFARSISDSASSSSPLFTPWMPALI
mmetsp:Transcript_21525/g.59090  ORF Transcript_21525/g.59090 Transcript_21525/m.59090 type:complete len:200 (-) Transcript_21525:64-663(-)